MFANDQLRQRMYDLMKPRNVVAVEATRFRAEQFESVSSEQTIVIHRAPTTVTNDPVQFWVSSVVSLDWWAGRGGGGRGYRSRFIRESLCRHLSESQFDRLVADHAGGLARPLRLPLHRHGSGGFRGALQMTDQWNDISAIAAYANELIAFYWMTTA
jgi:hypothetical protein